MNMQVHIATGPERYLAQHCPDEPILFFSPAQLTDSYRAFTQGFPGLVSFAVKSNPAPQVISTLVAAGMRVFDVASLVEIDLIRSICPDAVLHYNNPIRSRAEIRSAVSAGVAAYSVDRLAELEKLAELAPRGVEVFVRFKLPLNAAAYDFGTKFGASLAEAVVLLRRAHSLGFQTSLTFHPGTQCDAPDAWTKYIHAAANIAAEAGVTLKRLNVGGGFPSWRVGAAPDLTRFFAAIRSGLAVFDTAPALVCEPGRAMVAEAMTLAVRVKARAGDNLFLNDGIYGTMSEFSDIGTVDRIRTLNRHADPRPMTCFGPTCDSLDRLPQQIALPQDIAEEDYILIDGMGAYSNAIACRFNGYGTARIVSV